MYYNGFSLEEMENSEILEKVLNLSNKKDIYLNLRNFENSLIQYESKQEEEQKDISNPIYLEENETYYTQLLQYVKARRDILKSLNIYNNQYEGIVSDIERVIEKDSTIYSQIIDLSGRYLLLKQDSNLLTLSFTNREKESSEIDNNNFDTNLGVTPTVQAKNTVRIPVIMYHRIQNPPSNASSFVSGLYLSPENFEKQIAYLTKNNIKTISSKEFFEILKTGINPTQKTVMLTFDDSTTGHYTNAYRILKKYEQTGTFFVTSHRSQISNTQLKEMSDNGMDIQSHTQSHPDLVKLNNLNQLQSEIGGSKIELEARIGSDVVALAYPGCTADSKTYTSMQNNGYLLGFSCGKNIDHRYTSRLSIARIHNPTNIEDLIKILSGIYPF